MQPYKRLSYFANEVKEVMASSFDRRIYSRIFDFDGFTAEYLKRSIGRQVSSMIEKLSLMFSVESEESDSVEEYEEN